MKTGITQIRVPRGQTPAFDAVPTNIPGVEGGVAWKPNEAMQRLLVADIMRAMPGVELIDGVLRTPAEAAKLRKQAEAAKLRKR